MNGWTVWRRGSLRLRAGQAGLRADVDELKAGQAELKAGQAELRADVDELKAGQAELKAGQLSCAPMLTS